MITLGAMKAFALGRRAKWKDYNEKLFRTQLDYFKDIDYSETIDYMEGFEKNDNDIKIFLEKISLS